MKELVEEAFHHCKALGASGDAVDLLDALKLPEAPGVVAVREGKLAPFVNAFVGALAEHRHFDRPTRAGGGGVPMDDGD